MIGRLLVAVAVLGMALGGCSRGDGGAGAIKLDGSPRPPSDAGIATVATADRIEIDGKRRYEVSTSLLCFSTVTLEPLPLVQREGQYVHVGVRDGTVVWLASIGSVLKAGDAPPVVYYTGRLKSQDGRLATFADGTVLRLAPDVPKLEKARMQVEIDPDTDLVRRVTIG